MELQLLFKYQEIVADVGYESERNYLFLEENGQFWLISNHKTMRFLKLENINGISDEWKTWSMWKKATIIIAKTDRD